MKKKCWNVVLVPEGDGVVRSLRVSMRFLQAACGLFALGLIITAASVGVHVWSLQGLKALRAAKKENASLRTHLNNVDRALTQVESMVKEGERMERQARMLAGLPLPQAGPAPGLGGALIAATGQAASTEDPALSRTVTDQARRLEVLSRQATEQRQSLEETVTALRSLGDRLEHTPSICPVRAPFVLSSGFGWRLDPFTGGSAYHTGLDLRAPTGTPVHATAAGEVVASGHEGEYGITVRVRHGYGLETSYCHLSATRVNVGDQVRRGDVLGAVGTTGRSTGSHLHYEVRSDGAARDPAAYIVMTRTGRS